ncbi:MAG: MerC domain-containing protein [Halobacteriovoraceae bacterium]|nr:MerC domain-containing protein [Halobacteriovoraceae bacterium]
MKHIIDRIGITLSVVCLIHCFLLPILLVVFPFIEIFQQHETNGDHFHEYLLIFIVLVALFAFVPGFLKSRNKWLIILPLLAIANLSLVEFVYHVSTPLTEALLVSVSSLFLIAAHWINIKACDTCPPHSGSFHK